jgi:hypothetical protein
MWKSTPLARAIVRPGGDCRPIRLETVLKLRSAVPFCATEVGAARLQDLPEAALSEPAITPSATTVVMPTLMPSTVRPVRTGWRIMCFRINDRNDIQHLPPARQSRPSGRTSCRSTVIVSRARLLVCRATSVSLRDSTRQAPGGIDPNAGLSVDARQGCIGLRTDIDRQRADDRGSHHDKEVLWLRTESRLLRFKQPPTLLE